MVRKPVLLVLGAEESKNRKKIELELPAVLGDWLWKFRNSIALERRSSADGSRKPRTGSRARTRPQNEPARPHCPCGEICVGSADPQELVITLIDDPVEGRFLRKTRINARRLTLYALTKPALVADPAAFS
jgi:hypothetical protein